MESLHKQDNDETNLRDHASIKLLESLELIPLPRPSEVDHNGNHKTGILARENMKIEIALQSQEFQRLICQKQNQETKRKGTTLPLWASTTLSNHLDQISTVEL